MRFRLMLALAGLLFAAVACLGGSGGGDVSEALDPNTEPVRVTTTVDQSRAESARIGPAGGSLTATGADGSRYVLEIPADALVVETEITMTPIQSMDGLPLEGGLAAGVTLQPEGTTFYDFVSLTIEPGEAIPVEQQIPIGSSGESGAVHIPLIDSDREAIRLLLMHFSSAGVSKGLLADLGPVRQRLGGDVEARINSLYAQELARARQAGEDPDPSTMAALDKLFREKVLEPRIKAAGESCAAGRLAQETILKYGRQSDLMGLGYNWAQAMSEIVVKVARVCVREEYELCRDEHIVHRMIPVILGLDRQSQLPGGAGLDEVIPEAEDLAMKCLHFELEFESTARMESEETFNESEMESKIEISYDPATRTMTGSSALVNLNYEVSDPSGGPCTTTGNRGGGTFEVSNLYFDVDVKDERDQLGFVKDIWLTYAPGISTETITATCPGAGTLTTPPAAIWSNTYMGVHQSELGGSGGQEEAGGDQPPPIPQLTIDQIQGMMQSGAAPAGLGAEEAGPGATFTTKGWQVRGGDIFAVKEWDLAVNSGGASMTEEGAFKLYHRPE